MAKIVVAITDVLCIVVATALARSHGSALSLWYTVSAIVAGGLVFPNRDVESRELTVWGRSTVLK